MIEEIKHCIEKWETKYYNWRTEIKEILELADNCILLAEENTRLLQERKQKRLLQQLKNPIQLTDIEYWECNWDSWL